ncbi:hypothetical protein F5B18DRAFT_513552 [Nemania serpens]|nr:hypothetical protein F5B18DRAFT_513552 [Nemania serpens]
MTDKQLHSGLIRTPIDGEDSTITSTILLVVNGTRAVPEHSSAPTCLLGREKRAYTHVLDEVGSLKAGYMMHPLAYRSVQWGGLDGTKRNERPYTCVHNSIPSPAEPMTAEQKVRLVAYALYYISVITLPIYLPRVASGTEVYSLGKLPVNTLYMLHKWWLYLLIGC